jgi:hypothetical protein
MQGTVYHGFSFNKLLSSNLQPKIVQFLCNRCLYVHSKEISVLFDSASFVIENMLLLTHAGHVITSISFVIITFLSLCICNTP